MNGIGVVVVTYDSEREIGRSLDSLMAGGTACPTIVVDNGSTDGTLEEVRRRAIRLIANPWNRGFAAAVNQGIAALDCELVLVLNPDVELQSSLEPLAAECRKPGVAAAGGKLVGEDGRPQAGFMVRRFPTPWSLAFEILGLNRLWPGNPVNRRYRCRDFDPEAEASVEQPAGAFLMVRREIWQKLGGLDESFYPVWFEDVDFAKRVNEAGYTVRYTPATVAKHSGAHAVGRLSRSDKDRHWYGNLLKYAVKHFAGGGVVVVCTSLMLGSALRAVFNVLREKRLEAILSYGRIMRLAGACLVSGGRKHSHLSSAFAVD